MKKAVSYQLSAISCQLSAISIKFVNREIGWLCHPKKNVKRKFTYVYASARLTLRF